MRKAKQGHSNAHTLLTHSLQDSVPRHGDKIDVQWDGDDTFYPCTVRNGEAEGTLVVECKTDGEVASYDFDPSDGGWRWTEQEP